MRLIEIQEQLCLGEYEVDSHAVAEAIIRRLQQGHKPVSAELKSSQAECS